MAEELWFIEQSTLFGVEISFLYPLLVSAEIILMSKCWASVPVIPLRENVKVALPEGLPKLSNEVSDI